MNISITEHIRIDHNRRIVTIDEKEIKLTGLQFGLFEYLATHPNQIYSRDELIYHVWGNRFQYDTGTLDVHMSALRRKLGFSNNYPIETIRNMGFIFHKETKIAHYTIDLQTFVVEWLNSHSIELKQYGLVPSMHLTPFVNDITIDPKALQNMLDAVLAALLPSSQPGKIKITSKLTMEYFVLSLSVNGTINELKIPIQ